jgi:hypothetical protein
METAKIQHAGKSIFYEMIDDLIRRICPPLETKSTLGVVRKIKVVE